MKRFASCLLVFALILGMVPSALAAWDAEEYRQTPEKIDNETVWSYLDDNTDPAGDPAAESYDRTAWTATDFDDSAWKKASGTFGGKKTDEGITSNGAINRLDGIGGADGNGDNYPTYYFRAQVYVPDASAVTKIVGSIKYDDAAIVYINGVRAADFNADGCDSNSSYCSLKADTTSDILITDVAALGLVDGINTVAVEVHNESSNSSDIWFSMPAGLTFSTEALPTETALIGEDTVWSYLDDSTDPAGDPSAEDYDRTAWTASDFDDSTWKTAQGAFGSKRGKLHAGASTLLDGCPGDDTNYPTYYFRTTITLTQSQLEEKTKLVGRIQYDDAAIIYINGIRAAGFNDTGCDSNDSFCTNVAGGNPMEQDFEIIDPDAISALHAGENTVAVELHNRAEGSSDIFFGMPELALSDEAVDYQSNISLSMGADESQMGFTWYSMLTGRAALTISTEPDLSGAQTYSAETTAANDGQQSCQVTVTGLQPATTYYYRLSNAGQASETYSFTTAEAGAFSFAYVGDPQIGAGSTASDILGWEKTLNLIRSDNSFSDVAFLLSAGDQVNGASDEEQYDGYLDHEVLTGLPAATVVGNHDTGSDAYGQHFNIANESDVYGTTAAGGDSYFVYNSVLFMVLNSNDMSVAEHKAFMEQAIAATSDQDIQWKIVTFHHSLFTVASHAKDSYITDPTGFKAQLVPVLKELDIDVVLQGHDHVYCRTYMMDGLNPIRTSDKYEYGNGTDSAPTAVTDPDGILYVTANSGSGSKTYNIISADFPFSAVQNQEHVANISKVTVSDSRFTITTYRTSDMTEVDSFTINRTIAQDPGYKVTFNAEHATIDVYNTQDYTTPSEANASEAYARDPKTGEIDSTGNGQVNFRVNVEKGYMIDTVTADRNYKNLKGAEDTGAEGIYRLTKVSGPVTVTVTTKQDASTEPEEPDYTPVVTGNTRVNGYYDKTGSLKLELAGRYNSGAMNADGGSLEIVEYNPVNGYAYAVSGVKGKLIAVDLNASLSGDTVVSLSGTEYDLKAMIGSGGFNYGDMTSVAVSPDGSRVAAAIQDEDYTAGGAVALFACGADGALELLSTVSVGVQPDMVTFAGNNTILTADEGEPRNGVNGIDPKGSVSIITVGADGTMSSSSVYFDSFDEIRDELTAAGVLIQKGMQPSTDFEPEYIAVSGNTAYVSLQEANSIAVLDIGKAQFTGVYPLGLQDYGATSVDLQKNDAIELKKYENVYGIKMPDGISVTTIGSKTYLLTANEGDSRSDWEGYDNEFESKTSPTGNVTLDKKVVWFNASMWDGLDESRAYVFGGRSFSIYEVSGVGLKLVYDSGSDFEEITAERLPGYFNASNDKISMDNRSGKKGPEPESVVTGTVNGKTYAYIALERIGGVMVYDITVPSRARFVNYINSREFDSEIQGDVSPEGLCFVPAASGRKAMLLTACEVSGTLAVYELTPASSHSSSSGGSSSNSGSSSQKPSTETPEREDDTLAFRDVLKGDYFFDAVAWAVKNQITSGTSEASFSPDAPCTRAQIVTFLWRAAGSPEPEGSVSFSDVPSDSYYARAVAWAVENGITAGTGDGLFSPDAVCTRAQAVVFLYRAFGKQPVGSSTKFTDVPARSYYAGAVSWAVESSITDGTSDTTFSPDMDCTRAQIVTFLYRAAA